MLSEAAQQRLLHYARRAAISPPEYVGPRQARVINRQLRELIWADQEVRDALLVDDDFDALVGVLRAHRCPRALDLLDLMSAMSLERKLRATEQLAAA